MKKLNLASKIEKIERQKWKIEWKRKAKSEEIEKSQNCQNLKIFNENLKIFEEIFQKKSNFKNFLNLIENDDFSQFYEIEKFFKLIFDKIFKFQISINPIDKSIIDKFTLSCTI